MPEKDSDLRLEPEEEFEPRTLGIPNRMLGVAERR
jgi:hypothetical protein